jgi:hypothetical protein
MLQQLRSSPCLLAAALALCATQALAATCTRTIVAKAGDSCATVAATYGLTVSQFIQLNPTLGTCALTPSTTYCVSDNPAAAPTTTILPTTSLPPVAVPTSSLIPSPDGSEGVCGNVYTCLGSVYGDCCSEAGYCGNTTEYCGDGCNSVFGRCGGGIPPDTPAGPGTTATVTVTAAPGTCAATTKTVTLAPGTVVQTATITKLQTVTLAPSTVIQTATITKLQTVTQTVTVTASATGPAKPSPTLSGTYSNCELSDCVSKWVSGLMLTRVQAASSPSGSQPTAVLAF